ncbi:MAG: hypothetical protein QGI78_07180 [Phycisphaerales bacterium]|jgi:hypothetical protein|nr:hypothetical protein [Phycisphaerales bacterium]
MRGVLAFILVFFLMPIGHAVMILMNSLIPDQLVLGATVIFLLGLGMLIVTRFTPSSSWQSFLGAIAGVLLWTGGVEYGFLYGAVSLGIDTVNGTAGEYRLLMHTWSLLVLLLLYLVVHEGVRCNLFVWLRRKLRLNRSPIVSGKVGNYGPRTAFEMASILWFFYVLLLVLYDENLVGTHHVATYACLVLSLGGGLYLFYKLIRIKDLGLAIRYAIPTVIVLWNVVEILAKWNVFEEPWITLNAPIMLSITVATVAGFYFVIRDLIRSQKKLIPS